MNFHPRVPLAWPCCGQEVSHWLMTLLLASDKKICNRVESYLQKCDRRRYLFERRDIYSGRYATDITQDNITAYLISPMGSDDAVPCLAPLQNSLFDSIFFEIL